MEKTYYLRADEVTNCAEISGQIVETTDKHLDIDLYRHIYICDDSVVKVGDWCVVEECCDNILDIYVQKYTGKPNITIGNGSTYKYRKIKETSDKTIELLLYYKK